MRRINCRSRIFVFSHGDRRLHEDNTKQEIMFNVTKNQVMSDKAPSYRAYLLRLWCVAEEDGVVWRASLEDAHAGERRGFADVQSLYAFLTQQLEDASCQTRSAPSAKRQEANEKGGALMG